MTLVNTGPLVALCDPADQYHRASLRTLHKLRDPLLTTLPVLAEAFHMLRPNSPGAARLRALVAKGALVPLWSDMPELLRSFDLMETYADQPMDFADASLIAAAESLGTLRIFTLDRRDFLKYRIRKGRSQHAVEIVS